VDPAVRLQQQKIEEEKLEKMKQYCFTGRCLRNYILEYFGEKTGERCGKCGSCRKLTAAMAALGSTPARTAELDKTLYEILKSVRADYAKMYQLPPDLIFTDHTLQELCRKLPSTEEALLQVSGVTPAKVKRFGKPFLKAIARHADRRSGV
jgi:ATP-dependent DNA helicase RecQ